jgi:hypothetical protein
VVVLLTLMGDAYPMHRPLKIPSSRFSSAFSPQAAILDRDYTARETHGHVRLGSMKPAMIKVCVLALAVLTISVELAHAQAVFRADMHDQTEGGSSSSGVVAYFSIVSDSGRFMVGGPGFRGDHSAEIYTPAGTIKLSLGSGQRSTFTGCFIEPPNPFLPPPPLPVPLPTVTCDMQVHATYYVGSFQSSPEVFADLLADRGEFRLLADSGAILSGSMEVVPDPNHEASHSGYGRWPFPDEKASDPNHEALPSEEDSSPDYTSSVILKSNGKELPFVIWKDAPVGHFGTRFSITNGRLDGSLLSKQSGSIGFRGFDANRLERGNFPGTEFWISWIHSPYSKTECRDIGQKTLEVLVAGRRVGDPLVIRFTGRLDCDGLLVDVEAMLAGQLPGRIDIGDE